MSRVVSFALVLAITFAMFTVSMSSSGFSQLGFPEEMLSHR